MRSEDPWEEKEGGENSWHPEEEGLRKSHGNESCWGRLSTYWANLILWLLAAVWVFSTASHATPFA